MNLPYEPSSGTMPDVGDAAIAGGMVIMAAVVNVDDVGPMPALVFRFARPDGTGFYQPTVLVCEDEDLALVTQLASMAVDGALRAAEQARA